IDAIAFLQDVFRAAIVETDAPFEDEKKLLAGVLIKKPATVRPRQRQDESVGPAIRFAIIDRCETIAQLRPAAVYEPALVGPDDRDTARIAVFAQHGRNGRAIQLGHSREAGD